MEESACGTLRALTAPEGPRWGSLRALSVQFEGKAIPESSGILQDPGEAERFRLLSA